MLLTKLAASTILLSLPFLVTACGGDDKVSDASSPNSSTSSSSPAGTSGSASTPRTGGSSAPAPASVDVCGLFNADDAKAVVLATKSGGDTTMTATKVAVTSPKLGACKFQFDGTPAGTLVIEAAPADGMSFFRGSSKPLPGIGDEAFTNAGTPYVRVGGVMLSSGENSFTSNFVIEVFRRMAPKMK